MAIRKPSTAQPPLPSETSPLLNDQLHDGFGAENGQSQRDEGEQPQEGVKDMGNKVYAVLPAIAIGVCDVPSYIGTSQL